jgi:hypothetical protein
MSEEDQSSLDQRCWWAAGADPVILQHPDCPVSEQVRFAALGLFIWLTTGAAFVSGYLMARQVFSSKADGVLWTVLHWIGALALATLFALFVLNLLRLSVGLAGRRTDRLALLSLDVLRAVVILMVTGVLAVAVAAPLQVVVVQRDVQAAIVANEQVAVLERARAADLRQLDRAVRLAPQERLARAANTSVESGFLRKVEFAYAKNRPLCVVLLVAIWLLIAAPPAIRLFGDRGAYDFLVLHRNRALIAARGVEVEALTIYAPDGTPQQIDAFHEAVTTHEKRLSEILDQRTRAENDLQQHYRDRAAGNASNR